MLSFSELISLVSKYNPNVNKENLLLAYDYAKRAHKGQKRKSGEAYFNHPISVTLILIELKLDDETLMTALLHDTVEDTGSSLIELKKRFGFQISALVDGVTKLTNLELSSLETRQAENFRKLLIAMSKDLRVLLVKLADRLHNMRTIKALDHNTQVSKANETMEIYAPLAGRMGMQSIREELEDLCFSVLNPDARNSIMRRFVVLRKETGDIINKITQDIVEELNFLKINAKVIGREKRPYSIWRKMEMKKEGFHRLSDIYGFRIITDNVNDCYKSLGVVHQRWRAIPGRFKDYISQPKTNGYRSIHTTILGRDGKRVEVQIKTKEMNEIAESGVASHWSYRDGERFENPFAVDPFKWIKNLAFDFRSSENPNEFLENVKLEMFQDKVFCFTPKGEVVKLPRGATPIDFAYAIHTRIGDSCVGAKIDGQRKPLWSKLRNGQSITIIRAEGQRPQLSWEDMVITGRAKTAIRRSLKEETRSSHIKLGNQIARAAFEKIDKKVTDRALSTISKKLNFIHVDDLLVSLGKADINGYDLINTLYPNFLKNEKIVLNIGEKVDFIGLQKGQNSSVANCCEPVPNERIVGILEKGKGVLIHAIDCDNLKKHENLTETWIDIRWPKIDNQTGYPSSLLITILNSAGVLGRICTLIGDMGANITDMNFMERKADYYKIKIELHIRDIKHLLDILTSVEADTDVAEVLRYRDYSMNEY